MAKKRRPQSDPTKKPFTPETLDRTVIAIPLLNKIEKDGLRKPQNVIITSISNIPTAGKRLGSLPGSGSTTSAA